MRAVMVAAGLSVTLVLAGCGGDDGDTTTSKSSTSTSTVSSTTTSTTTTSTTTTAPCNFSGSTTPEQDTPGSEVQYLTDVTVVANGCLDVITFTFRGNTTVAPSYQIGYEPGPFFNSAGVAVRPAGTAFLKIRFEPAWIVDMNQEGAPLTYPGPKMITPTGTNGVRDLTLFDASEAVLAWVAGVDRERPFHVDAGAGQVVITLGP